MTVHTPDDSIHELPEPDAIFSAVCNTCGKLSNPDEMDKAGDCPNCQPDSEQLSRKAQDAEIERRLIEEDTAVEVDSAKEWGGVDR